MKRILLSGWVMLIASLSIAQDLIVTRNSEKIEAQITEVSKSEIKYKEWNNLNGPTFVLGTGEIHTIIYSNGKVVVYNQEKEESQKEEQFNTSMASHISENTAEILLLNGQKITAQVNELRNKYVSYTLDGWSRTIPASQIEKVTFLKNGQIKQYNSRTVEAASTPQKMPTETPSSSLSPTSHRIYRENGHYLHNDIYISSQEVERILQRENKTAYKQWKKADGMIIGGAICIGIGGGLALGGIFPLIRGKYTTTLGLECAALVPLGIGLGLTIGASAKYNQAIDIYNSKYDQAAIQLQWYIAPTEVGLAIVF